MRKFALTLAISAPLGLATPAFAAEGVPTTRARTLTAQAVTTPSLEGKGDKAMAKPIHYRRSVNKLVRHDRGLHRGSAHARDYVYGKVHYRLKRAR